MSDLDTALAELTSGGARTETARRLASHGGEAIDRLGDQIATGVVGPVTATTFLRMVASAGFVEPLAPLLQHDERAVRAAAVEALGHSCDAAAVPHLVAALDGTGLWADAVRGLGAHGGPAAKDALSALWAEQVGDDTTGAINRQRKRRALQKLLTLAEALARTGLTQGEQLVVELSRIGRAEDLSWSAMVRNDAARALAWFVGADTTSALVDALRDDEAEVGETAVRSLASFGTAACLPALVDRYELDSRVARPIQRAIYDLVGASAPEDGVEPSELRRWWMKTSATMSSSDVLWQGEPADPERVVQQLTTNVGGGTARSLLELWTGIDFVDDAQPGVAGDDTDRERAEAWWRHIRSTWHVGALYRAGHPHDIGPIVSALASNAA